MTAYIIARVDINDWEQYKKYLSVTPEAIAEFGGRFIARGGELATLEGPTETRRVVLLEFPSLERAKAFYDSPKYAEAKKLRAGAAIMEMIAVEGV